MMSYLKMYNVESLNDVYQWVTTWHSCIHGQVYLKMLYLKIVG